MIWHDLLALIATFALALAWLRFNDHLAQRGVMSSWTSRKSIHIGTGPLFILCWLLFSGEPYVRWLAALVPLAITIQFMLVGLGLTRDEAAVQAMSRTGDPAEILRGPVYYGAVFVVLTVAFWLDHPAGIVALGMLCAGDGFAEIFGRKYGGQSLLWNLSKTWVGSLAFLLGGFLLTTALLLVFQAAGAFTFALNDLLLKTLLISIACMLVESITPHDLDNLSVPLAAVLLSMLL